MNERFMVPTFVARRELEMAVEIKLLGAVTGKKRNVLIRCVQCRGDVTERTCFAKRLRVVEP